MNKVLLIGGLSQFKYSHEVMGEKFYTSVASVKRMSGVVDEVPLMVSEEFIDAVQENDTYKIEGQFRSYNNRDGEPGDKLKLYVFVTDLTLLAGDVGIYKVDHRGNNCIELDGFICKDVTYRETPLGRKVTDMLVAANRPFGKSDYIPSIIWGRKALWACRLKVGNHIKLLGRIQSRQYTKRHDDVIDTMTAYEVSVNKIIKVAEEAAAMDSTNDAKDCQVEGLIW